MVSRRARFKEGVGSEDQGYAREHAVEKFRTGGKEDAKARATTAGVRFASWQDGHDRDSHRPLSGIQEQGGSILLSYSGNRGDSPYKDRPAGGLHARWPLGSEAAHFRAVLHDRRRKKKCGEEKSS